LLLSAVRGGGKEAVLGAGLGASFLGLAADLKGMPMGCRSSQTLQGEASEWSKVPEGRRHHVVAEAVSAAKHGRKAGRASSSYLQGEGDRSLLGPPRRRLKAASSSGDEQSKDSSNLAGQRLIRALKGGEGRIL